METQVHKYYQLSLFKKEDSLLRLIFKEEIHQEKLEMRNWEGNKADRKIRKYG